MDITMIGLQNAGKTSLLRVLAVGSLVLLLDRYLDLLLRVGPRVGGGRVRNF